MEDILNCVFQVIENYRTKVHYAGATNHIVKHVKVLTKNTKPNPQKLFVIKGIWAFNMAFTVNWEFLDVKLIIKMQDIITLARRLEKI